MAFNHSDTDRIAIYPNRPPKKLPVPTRRMSLKMPMQQITIDIPEVQR